MYRNPTGSPIKEGIIEVLTTQQSEQTQDGLKGIGNIVEINWTDMHHVMFYIIIGVLVCIICVISFIFTTVHKKDKRKYDALKLVTGSGMSPSTNTKINMNYDTLDAHSPKHIEMTSMTDMGNMQAMLYASNAMPIISSPMEAINTNDLPPVDDYEHDNNKVQNGINEGNITNESEEEDDLGLYGNDIGITPNFIHANNNDITPQ